jgi:uncharacterized SAM-binding protein YcdF (DUF218 family)
VDIIVGKWLFAMAKPSSLLVLALLVGVLFARFRVGRWLLGVVALVMLVVTVARLGDRAVVSLERGWSDVPLPQAVDGIVVLGGGNVLRPPPGRDEREARITDTVERVLAPFWLMQRYPEARLVFTGGAIGGSEAATTEAEHVAWLWAGLGLDAEVTYEAGSWNTRHNAVMTRDLVQPKDDERWLLVTSALHMRRAMATFERAGWRIHPYAVDRLGGSADRRGWHSLDWLEQWMLLDLAAREWIGFAVYRLRGWA